MRYEISLTNKTNSLMLNNLRLEVIMMQDLEFIIKQGNIVGCLTSFSVLISCSNFVGK